MANEYDVIIIGAGTGGYVAAIRAAQLGLTVAVVEKQKALGGTCLLWGCIPTKALLEHAHALKIAQHAKEWGLTIGEAAVGIDMVQVQARKDRIVTGLTKGVEFLFKKNKISWIKGTARLMGNGSVDVFEGDTQTLRARKEIIVATGSAPRGVPGVEIDRKRIITSDEAIGFREVPKTIAIMGSGAVGVEFASIFRRFGSDVTILELLPRLVPVEDEAVSAELEKSFRKQGVTSHTGAKVTSAVVNGDGVDIEAQLADGTVKTMRADYLLVATGRGPVTAGLDVERVGLEMEKGYIKVDAQYRTNVPGISAVGDVITLGGAGHPQLAHVSSAEGILAAERIAGQDVPAAQLRPRARLHLLRSGNRQRRPDRARSQGARLRRAHRHVSVRRAGPRQDGGRDRRVREDRGRQEIRRGAGRPHDWSAVDRARRRSDGGAAARIDRRRADSHHSRAPDDGRGRRRSGARGARRRDPRVNSACRL